jgi:hypothetical protein
MTGDSKTTINLSIELLFFGEKQGVLALYLKTRKKLVNDEGRERIIARCIFFHVKRLRVRMEGL